MALVDDQQFCLKWNNFQANITSQFETLRGDEDFTDVTIACDGQRLQAHKVVLSACSPFFKELFKTNPCPHPIIFMRDVEAQHITSLMEFMYAGEVNIAQTHLSTFLKTAESLKIRGLTDTSSDINKEDILDSQKNLKHKIDKSKLQIFSSTIVTSSQDVPETLPKVSSPPPKRLCMSESEILYSKQDDIVGPCGLGEGSREESCKESTKKIMPKLEMPDYLSDDGDDDDDVGEYNDTGRLTEMYPSTDIRELTGGMEIIPQTSSFLEKDGKHEPLALGNDTRKLHSLDPRPCDECGKVYSNLSNLRQHMRLIHYPTYVQCVYCQKQFKTDLYLRRHIISSHTSQNVYKGGSYNEKTLNNTKFYDMKSSLRFNRRKSTESWLSSNNDQHVSFFDDSTEFTSILRRQEGEQRNRLIKLGNGIEIYEDQLRSVKWSDYRKLTRGLATILFSPAELATCSVTGQRWSRAGNGERPVKPALDRAKVQAIISYVANRFPMIEISRIKQVLAYKCKENSTAFKMKAVRYYGEQMNK